MNSTDEQILKFMSGLPVMYKDICLVESPSLRKIAAEGLDNFYQYIGFLTIQKPDAEDKELKKSLSQISDFEYLILLTQLNKENYNLAAAAFEFFTNEKPTFVVEPPSIVLGDPTEKRALTKDTYYGFTDLVLLACAMKDPKEQSIEFLDTDTAQVRKLKEQMLKGRRDRKKKNSSGKKSDLLLSDLVGSLTIGTATYNLVNIWDLTYYALQDQLKRMSWKEEFNINTRASLAGAKLDKSKLTHWLKPMSFN